MIDPFVFAFCVCISCAQVVLGLKHFFVQFVGVVPEDSRCWNSITIEIDHNESTARHPETNRSPVYDCERDLGVGGVWMGWKREGVYSVRTKHIFIKINNQKAPFK